MFVWDLAIAGNTYGTAGGISGISTSDKVFGVFNSLGGARAPVPAIALLPGLPACLVSCTLYRAAWHATHILSCVCSHLICLLILNHAPGDPGESEDPTLLGSICALQASCAQYRECTAGASLVIAASLLRCAAGTLKE